jgi:ribosomal protein S18 acetylase RimI-like enzyme
MKTRKATVADMPAIQKLNMELDNYHAALLPEYFRTLSDNARPDSQIKEWIESPDSCCAVAEHDGNIIGFIFARKASHPAFPMFRKHEFAMVENAVVKEGHRGKGAGAQLFNVVAEWAREKGLSRIQLSVWAANKNTKEFYIRRGFKPIMERLELDIGGGKKE